MQLIDEKSYRFAGRFGGLANGKHEIWKIGLDVSGIGCPNFRRNSKPYFDVCNVDLCGI